MNLTKIYISNRQAHSRSTDPSVFDCVTFTPFKNNITQNGYLHNLINDAPPQQTGRDNERDNGAHATNLPTATN